MKKLATFGATMALLIGVTAVPITAQAAPAQVQTAQAVTYLKTPYFDTIYEMVPFSGGTAAVPMSFERWIEKGQPTPKIVAWIPQAMTVARAFNLRNGAMVETSDLFVVSMKSTGWQTAYKLSFAQWQAAGYPMPTADSRYAPHVFIFKYADSPDLFMNIDSNVLSPDLWRTAADKLKFEDWRDTGYAPYQVVPRV